MTTAPEGARPDAAVRSARRRLGQYLVNPIGYGAMRLTGPGIFGPPADLQDAVRLLREAVDDGVDHIDTAEYYGPKVVNDLIRRALHPYPPGLVVVSKVGARRDDRGGIFAYDQPAQLRKGIQDNLRTLGLSSLPVVNLRLMSGSRPDAFFDDQLAAMARARDDGLIEAVGLSNVTLEHLLHALRYTDIVCVQNAYHPVDRSSQPVLDECSRRGIAFVPFSPLGSGAGGTRSPLRSPAVLRGAARLGCSPAQLLLAWGLHAAPNVLLIPGTASRAHLQENLDAALVRLDDKAVSGLSAVAAQM